MTRSKSDTRWGILATGEIAHAFTRELIAHGHNVQAVGSRSLEGAKSFAESFGIPRAHGFLKHSSLHVLQVAWRIHVEPVWGDRRIGEIQNSEVQDWVSRLSSIKSATVVIRAYGILAGVIDRGVRDRRLPLDVARGVNLPRKLNKQRSYLSHDQVQALSDESGSNATLVLLLAYVRGAYQRAITAQSYDK